MNKFLLAGLVGLGLLFGSVPVAQTFYHWQTFLPVVFVPVPAPTQTPAPDPRAGCEPSYPDVCIPYYPPDLDCADIPYRRFRVFPPDPHWFDGDYDGIGCEWG